MGGEISPWSAKAGRKATRGNTDSGSKSESKPIAKNDSKSVGLEVKMQKLKVKSAGQKLKLFIFSFLVIFLVLSSYFLFINRRILADETNSDNQIKTATVAPSQTPSFADLSWPSGQTIDAPILMYHHVGALLADADDIRRGLTVSAEDFETQMKFLKDNSYDVLTLAEMYGAVAKDSPLQKSVVLTFDDGYTDNFDVARPILQKYGFKGTFFIISGKIGESEYMNEAQIRELAKAGNEIGSHSVSHPDLANLSDAKVKTEVEKSKADLEALAGQKIISFCYPAGKFATSVEKILEMAGYKIAVTTKKWQPFSTDKPFEVPRYRINPGTSLKNLLSSF